MDSAVLSGLLRRFDWAGPWKPVWVTFQGLYDVAYLVKLLTRGPLPPTLRGFARLVGETLWRVVDVKHVSGSHLSLVALSRSLGLTTDRASAHLGGVDSLLTGKAFSTRQFAHAGSTECRMCGKPKVRNAGRMPEVRNAGTRKNVGRTPEERREESEDGEENSEERPKEELDKSIFDNLG